MTSAPDARVLSIASRGPARSLIVLLHGYGATGEDLLPVARALSAQNAAAELLVLDGFHRAPNGGRQWWSVLEMTDDNRGARIEAAGDELERWLDAQLSARGLSSRALVLLGFSQGAALALEIASRRPLRAVVSLCGKPVPRSSRIERTPILLVHGARDHFVAVDEAERNARALAARGARVSLFVQPGLGHGVDRGSIEESARFLQSL